ncbi:hypothetical protein B0O99DRAFT_592373 [Bisporella sp. PMI_857]|nr:hypothetical protein B0O99DRAFT_592373 [Bisporella sp. PMI_857]
MDDIPEDYEMIESQEANIESEDISKIQVWLQPTDYAAESSEFHSHLYSHIPETGLWVCETSQFEQWRDSDKHASLWIKGPPGVGKSVISAAMADYLRNIGDGPVLYFFFRYIVDGNHHPRGLLCDWLAQLIPFSPRVQAILQPLAKCILEDVTDGDLWDYILDGLRTLPKFYCVVDALDEMDQSDKIISCIVLMILLHFDPNQQS